MPSDYSEAISKGVRDWMDANKDAVLIVIAKAIEPKVDGAMVTLARAMNKKVNSFFDDNKEEMIATMAAAIACMWDLKNRPSVGAPS